MRCFHFRSSLSLSLSLSRLLCTHSRSLPASQFDQLGVNLPGHRKMLVEAGRELKRRLHQREMPSLAVVGANAPPAHLHPPPAVQLPRPPQAAGVAELFVPQTRSLATI